MFEILLLRKIIFLLLLTTYQFFGQNPHYFTIDKSKGLPSNSIYDIIQDKNGMLWLATNEGLCNFDGRKFSSFSSDVQVSKSGSNIVEDKFGRIWYCTFDGSIYFVQNGILQPLPGQKIMGYQKFAVLKDYFIYLEDGLLIFLDLKTLKLIKKIPFETSYLIATHVFKDVFYIFTKGFMFEIKGIDNIKKNTFPKSSLKNFTVSMTTNTADHLVLITKYTQKYGLYFNGVFKEFDFKTNINFMQNATYTSGKNWISTTKGIVKFDIKNPNLINRYFEDYNISNILQDKEGNHWITTLGKGLLLVPNFNTYLIPTPDIPSKLNSIDNTYIFSTKNDKIYSYKDVNNTFEFKEIFKGNSNHAIEQLDVDAINQKIFFTSNTFKTLSLKDKKITEVVHAVKDLDPIDSKYYAYAATGTSGLFKAGNGKSKWDTVFDANNIQVGLDGKLSALVENVRAKSTTYNAENETIYFATNKGLFAANINKTETILWNNKAISLIRIAAYKGIVYGLTSGNKLICIDAKNHVRPVRFSIDENVFQNLKLIGSSLYLFTNTSILKYDLEKNNFLKAFNQNAENEISDIIEFQDHYLLASTKGLIRSDASQIKQNHMPKFIIQEVLVNDKKTTVNELKSLSSKENAIEILYSVISFEPNLKNILYYKINDEKWLLIDDEIRSLKLSSLASGDYTIQFKTAYNNQFSDVQTLAIYIEKPFIQTFWFYGLSVLLLLLIAHFFYRNEIQKIKIRNQLLLDKIELEKNLNQSTLKAIKSQMNPHFFYNALNTIQSYILDNDKKQAVNFLSKFSSLTRTILEMSDKESVTVAEEIKTLSFYLDIEKARFNDDFEYEFITQDSTLDQNKIPSLLLQPYIENAIKHGLLHKSGPKKLTIKFEINSNYLDISIIDDGIGRKKSEELKKLRKNPHQSFATEAMQHKIELLNKHKKRPISIEIIDLYSTQNVAKGTTVLIKIPLDFYYS